MSFPGLSTYVPQLLPRRQSRIRSIVALLAAMAQAIEARRQLAEMDDRMLSDIGISRADAQREAARAPWDLSS